MFEWDETKRARNLEKHGLDFLSATLLFDGRPVVSVPATSGTEPRVLTVGRMDNGKFCTVVWTQRGESRRIISFRRSRRAEEGRYRALHG
jgi:uncharacterized DUF497 family protein